ncbi:hypothetical protein ACIO8G_18740 [Streptomyces sp. NPDC087219]|uniref:hypothetical protein n=1 Tax=Streptomyces sp. NPDC087219 TaxID=3365770 RepID=UPI00382E0C01
MSDSYPCPCRGHRVLGVPLDPAWRPLDLARDSFQDRAAEDRAPWPDDHSVLCQRLPTFWRRDHP